MNDSGDLNASRNRAEENYILADAKASAARDAIADSFLTPFRMLGESFALLPNHPEPVLRRNRFIACDEAHDFDNILCSGWRIDDLRH